MTKGIYFKMEGGNYYKEIVKPRTKYYKETRKYTDLGFVGNKVEEVSKEEFLKNVGSHD